MYAVIRTGGKQYRVKVGDVIDVEKLPADDGADLRFEPLLVVEDDGNVRSVAGDLAGASVSATVLDTHRGEKIRVFTYKNKTGQRRTMGHRQSLTRLRVAGIELPGATRAKARTTAEPKAEANAEAKTEAAAEARAEEPKPKPARARAKADEAGPAAADSEE